MKTAKVEIKHGVPDSAVGGMAGLCFWDNRFSAEKLPLRKVRTFFSPSPYGLHTPPVRCFVYRRITHTAEFNDQGGRYEQVA